MKIISWNVNGLRACGRNGFINWFEQEKADVVCVQEIKVNPEQLEETARNPSQYHSYWHSAEKPGYSGVAIFSKKEPLSLKYGIGVPEIDREGRVITAEYQNFTLINSYFPNSQREGTRLHFKLRFCQEFLKYCQKLKKKGKNLVLCADWNIAHTEIDLKNPKTNMKNAGFLPEERAWMSEFISQGYIDSFRHFTKDPGHYTWWSYRPGVRERNIGWRLDYFMTNKEFTDRLKASVHQNHVMGSDHCPVVLQIKK
jgi:exodeoxyribonuclease III